MSPDPLASIRAELVTGMRCINLYLYGGDEATRKQLLWDLDLVREIPNVIYIGELAFGDSRHSTEADGSYFIRPRGSVSAVLTEVCQRLAELLTTERVTVRATQSVS